MFFTKTCPSARTKYVSFELLLGILRGPGEGRGGAPGTVPFPNPQVTSRKACLRNAENCSHNVSQKVKRIFGAAFPITKSSGCCTEGRAPTDKPLKIQNLAK